VALETAFDWAPGLQALLLWAEQQLYRLAQLLFWQLAAKQQVVVNLCRQMLPAKEGVFPEYGDY